MKNVSATKEIKIAPEAKGEFLLGNLREFRRDFLGTLTKNFDENGDIVRFYLGNRVVHAVRHPDFAREILVTRGREFLKPKLNEGLGLVLGKGLVSNDDNESWLTQRRMMQPIFHRQHIADLAEEMTAAGENLLNRWNDSGENPTVNMTEEMMRLTLEVITKTMFGTDVSDQTNKIGEAVQFLSHFIHNRLQNPLSLPLKIPTPKNLAFQKSTRMINEIIEEIIRQRRTSVEKREDLLQMLLDAREEETGEGMNEEQIRNEVLTIFAAGHETTANALTWTWFLLSQHPEVFSKMQAEIDEVLQGEKPTLADIPKLKYVSQVFNESLRLFPPVVMIPRRVDAETTLQGYQIPKDSLVFVNIYHIQRHPDLWENADEFIPERWEENLRKEQPQLAFMPFGAGQRLCIGNHFALMEGTLFLAQIAQKFTPQLAEKQQVTPDVGITMTPKKGLLMKIKKRNL